MPSFSRVLFKWMPLGVAITFLCGLIYASVQQEYRQSLNDPQIQIAEDVASVIGQGASPTSVIPSGKVDIGTSLAPWVAIYDANGNVLAYSGQLNGEAPKLPQGVFDTTTWHSYAEDGIPVSVPSSEDRFSWQPQSDVRQAVVLIHASNGDFVAAGRNMREVEDRVNTLTHMVGLGWFATIIVTLGAQALAEYFL